MQRGVSKKGAIFSAATEQWRQVTGFFSSSGNGTIGSEMSVRYYARSCFYWTHPFRKNLLVLDTGEMKFSFVDLLPKSLGTPLQHLALKHAVVELGEGRLGLLTLGSDGLELYLRDNGADAQEWRHSKTVPMPKDRWCIIIGATEGYVLILQTGSSPHMPDPQYFTLELKTMMIERLSKMCSRISHHHLYANFPPPLSPPNI